MAISGIGQIKDILEDQKHVETSPILLIQDASNPDILLLCELEQGIQLPENIIGSIVKYEAEATPTAEAVNPFFTRRKNKIGPASLPKIRVNKLEFPDKNDVPDQISRG